MKFFFPCLGKGLFPVSLTIDSPETFESYKLVDIEVKGRFTAVF